MRKTFFIGYLDFPRSLKSFFQMVIPFVFLIGLSLNYILGAGTKEAGTGQWYLDEEITLQGILELKPYPMLRTTDRPDYPVLLVQMGKVGADDLAAGLDGRTVSVKGFKVERGRWQILEIESAANISVIDDMALPALADSPGMYVSLKGEVVDSKCMLGVMKPGSGKVHRDCAALCLLGGMPPMLLAKTQSGKQGAYLLVDENGKSLSKRMAAHVAVPVELSGIVYTRGNMPVMKVDSKSPRRLDGQERVAFGSSIGLANSGSFCLVGG